MSHQNQRTLPTLIGIIGVMTLWSCQRPSSPVATPTTQTSQLSAQSATQDHWLTDEVRLRSCTILESRKKCGKA